MRILYTLIIGSFLQAHARRQVSGQQTILSVCDFCQNQLTLQDLLPLFSYFRLKGRSRCCQQKLPISYLFSELLSLVLGILFSLETYSFFKILLCFSLYYNIWLDYYTQYLSYPLLLLAWGYALGKPTFSFLHLVFIFFLCLASLLHQLGWGDTILLSALLVRYDIILFNGILLVSSLLALLFYSFIKKDQREIPFGPFICVVFLGLLYIIP